MPGSPGSPARPLAPGYPGKPFSPYVPNPASPWRGKVALKSSSEFLLSGTCGFRLFSTHWGPRGSGEARQPVSSRISSFTSRASVSRSSKLSFNRQTKVGIVRFPLLSLTTKETPFTVTTLQQDRNDRFRNFYINIWILARLHTKYQTPDMTLQHSKDWTPNFTYRRSLTAIKAR